MSYFSAEGGRPGRRVRQGQRRWYKASQGQSVSGPQFTTSRTSFADPSNGLHDRADYRTRGTTLNGSKDRIAALEMTGDDQMAFRGKLNRLVHDLVGYARVELPAQYPHEARHLAPAPL